MEQVQHHAPRNTHRTQKSPITILRDYLTSLTPEIIDHLSHIDEVAMRAKIIVEYMQANQISDVNQGIRSFTAFERFRLEQLGLIKSRAEQATGNAPARSALATAIG